MLANGAVTLLGSTLIGVESLYIYIYIYIVAPIVMTPELL